MRVQCNMMVNKVAAQGLSLSRVLLFLLITGALFPLQLLAMTRGWRLAVLLPMFYHRQITRVFGFRTTVKGTILRASSTLFVSNHISYSDIFLLGGVVPGNFVAKSEVAGWPLFGFLAKLQRTVFIERQTRRSAEQRDVITERLQSGDSLILFPEGTSGDSLHVLPFKSALFSVADQKINGKPVLVQPVSLSYVRLNGIPLGRAFRPFFAWYGDMELAGHLWTMLGLGIVDVVIEFHDPVTLDQFGSRKHLANHCHTVIARGVALANGGRLIGDHPPIAAPHPHRANTVTAAS